MEYFSKYQRHVKCDRKCLSTCGWSVYGRLGHPAFREWSTLSWCSYPHLQIGTAAVRGRGPIDQKISDLGLTRRVGAVIPYFAMASSILAETDMLLTVPSMSMKNDQHTAQLEQREVPFETIFNGSTKYEDDVGSLEATLESEL